VIIEQGKEKEKKRKKGEGSKKKSERGLERPIVAFLFSPNKNVRLWQLQTISFFFPLK
jgi:hypothetical protein